MQKKLLALAVLTATTGLGIPAQAAPFGSFDARSAGMGNAGVAAATLANAAFFNPAMLAAQPREDDFAMLLPAVGARVADPDGLIDDIDAFQAAYNATNVTAADAALASASGKAVLADGNAGLVAAWTGARSGGAVLVNAYTRNSINIDAGTVGAPTYSDATLNTRGIQVAELGLSLAQGYGNADARLAVGVTPKYQYVKTNDVSEPLTSASTNAGDLINNAANQTDDSGMNLDVGVSFGEVKGWRVGVIGRNLISKDYTTVNANTISLEPQWRGGVAYGGGWFTLAADIDLKENTPVSFDQKTRMLAVGTEFNILKTVQLRAGWQHNLADTGASDPLDLYSLGVGLKVLGFHVDVAAVGNENDVGAVAQVGFTF